MVKPAPFHENRLSAPQPHQKYPLLNALYNLLPNAQASMHCFNKRGIILNTFISLFLKYPVLLQPFYKLVETIPMAT